MSKHRVSDILVRVIDRNMIAAHAVEELRHCATGGLHAYRLISVPHLRLHLAGTLRCQLLNSANV